MADNQITQLEGIKEGEFIRFVDKDKQGKFSHVGEVVKVLEPKKDKPGYFEMLTFDGIMGFAYHPEKGFEDDIQECATKPKGWAKFKKDPKAFRKSSNETKAEPVKTKKQQVFELVANNPRKKEKSLLQLASKEIGGSTEQLEIYIKLALAKK